MIKTALWELQKAIFFRLNYDPDLSAVVTRVYDEVPADDENETAGLPFITLGEDTAGDFSSKTFYGEELTHTLHVWSGYPGKKEAKQIINLVLAALTREPLQMPGFTVVISQREFIEVFQDGALFHGVVRLRFKTIQDQ